MAASATTPRRAKRFPRSVGWPQPLLEALAAHAARLTHAREAAICAWPAGEERRPAWSAATRHDPRWHAALAAVTVADATSAATICEIHGSPTMLAGFRAPGRQGVLAVSDGGADPFGPADLALLCEVRDLVVAALEAHAERTVRGTTTTTEEEPRAEPFHHRLPRAFERLEGLPALSQSRDNLLAVLNAPAPSTAAIVAAIESDVALVITVLRLANEAEGSARPAIWSIPEAIRVLTPEGIAAMARRLTVFDYFQRIRGWAVPPEHFRLHAIATQRVTQQLGRLVEHPDLDHLVVAALLHDVGKLVLTEAFSGYPVRVLGPARTPDERLQAERRELGLDHQMAGGVLLRRWRLPERLAEIVGRHHDAGAEDTEAALIRLADAVAHYAHGRPVTPRELERAAAALGLSRGQLRTLMFEASQPGAETARAVEPSPLTRRETELLQLLARGLTYKEMAHEVRLAPSTVRSHLNNIYRKMGVIDRAQAVLTATAQGWI